MLWLGERHNKQSRGGWLNTAWEGQRGWPGFPPTKSCTAKPEGHQRLIPVKAKGKRELKARQPSPRHTSSSSLWAVFSRNQCGGGSMNRVHCWRFGCARRDCKILAQEPGRESKDLKGFLLFHGTMKAADRDNVFCPDACLQTGNLFLHIYL